MITCPRLTIAGLGGDTGKTVISVGLSRTLQKQGYKVVPFKKGPDYIDMNWLSLAADHPCYNLDLFLMSRDQVNFSFSYNSRKADIAIIEGNRGIYDGMDIDGSASTAEVAKLLRSPVILIVDCTKITRTVAALVLGCQKLDQELSIKGVILNKLANSRQEDVIKKSIEYYCKLPVVGAIPRLKDIPFPGRHLGLLPPEEHPLAEEAISTAGEIIAKYVDTEQLWQIARQAPPLLVNSQQSLKQSLVNSHSSLVKPSDQCPVTNDQLRIGIIRDSAFQFYYQENIDALKKSGAEVIEFSALTDDLPQMLDALYIGGGFPETHAEVLSANKRLRQAIKKAAEDGLPIYAECGGLMYLCEELVWSGKTYPMVGIFPIVIGVSKKPQGHGYSILEVVNPNPYFRCGQLLHGHEFHYSHVLKMTEKDKIYFAFKMKRGQGIINKIDGLCYKNVLATYTHLHALGTREWADGIFKVISTYKEQ
ncbi:MAG: cobyrinate a,c-diamide synthase [Nitrospirota bacterium]